VAHPGRRRRTTFVFMNHTFSERSAFVRVYNHYTQAHTTYA